ncbi:hypothetical protein MC885_008192 [Smutsia gigantea]|nr:hypothetical protein MC885_008192 [Smutsia gigantea]
MEPIREWQEGGRKEGRRRHRPRPAGPTFSSQGFQEAGPAALEQGREERNGGSQLGAPRRRKGELSLPSGRDSQTWRGPVLPSQPLACHLSQAWGHNCREVPGAGTACHAALTWSR